MTHHEDYQQTIIKEMIRAFQEGSGDREEILYQLLIMYRPLIQRYRRQFYNLGLEQTDFEQEMALSVWLSAEQYDPAFNVTFGAYLSVRLYNRCLDLYRFHRHPKRCPPEGTLSLADDETADGPLRELPATQSDDYPDYSYAMRETLDRLYARLSPLEARVLSHSIDGKTFPEIASVMLVSEDRVRYAYYRAHRKFRKGARDDVVAEED
ncbi:MAG: sigma-70 family RNA polymerase sigma factor [Aerococcus sp.]|nr:sigma-70 family RNA polymerase sigma factor [Aerococcus sp.]